MNWISVSDNLPKFTTGVLVTDGIIVGYAMWNKEILKWICVETPWENFKCNVTHWMPLPEPPNE